MSYYFSKKISCSFDEAVANVTDELQKEGFGVMTEIDVKATLKKKLDVDFPRYQILGACHPQSAYQALQLESKIGLMLPCNVIVREMKDGGIEVAAVDPMASMQAVENRDLAEVAKEVRGKLQKIIARM
ncbi:hypothetical protein CEE37_13675 [candidate division LCP-89 bacterium B3_LCP]|uniref:DUF302 domain-containing protein n=1 Tax=candidate division LCP-89 bacterium B3_LCP TaxID=2012998 RepID=A0A532URK8_UNCL8|nr:MAG: hypothetical protein CEE37_13675 [candidate division LCP-89 bacterium B3_LCP]